MIRIETLEEMAASGLTLDQAIRILKTAHTRTSGAERQARYRARHHNVTGDVTGDATPPAPLQGKESPPEPPKENPTSPLTPVSDADASSPRPSRGAFDRFWKAYPRKVGKGAAKTAYPRAWKRAGGPDPEAVILAGLELGKRAWAKRDEPDFIPHPATWLNQDRWEDDPEPGSVIAFTAPPLTPQQQADLERINAERRSRPSSAGAGLRPVDALGALAGRG